MGKFITIEGQDGSGKSVNAQFIFDWLDARGLKCIKTREPGGTVISEAIRKIILDPKNYAMDVDTELLMFASRAQHLREKVIPAVSRGEVVVSDRYIDSSYAYQGAKGVFFERIWALDEWTSKGFKPDLTFVLDLPVEVSMERIQSRGEVLDRFDSSDKDFFNKTRQIFLEKAASDSRYVVIDASQDLDGVQRQIAEHLKEFN